MSAHHSGLNENMVKQIIIPTKVNFFIKHFGYGLWYIGDFTHEDWKGTLPHYAFKCKHCGRIGVTWPKGHYRRIECPNPDCDAGRAHLFL